MRFISLLVDKRNLNVATPPQLYSAVGAAQPSVITRLSRPGQGPPFGKQLIHYILLI